LNRKADLNEVGALDTGAFFLPAGPVGCLLLHGFTATPYDMRYIAGHLHGRDVTVSAVRLPGHATSPEDMERHTWSDWVEGARAGLFELKNSVERVVVVGQSMGALLALKLAAEHPREVDAVALLSTALVASARWMYWAAPVVPWLTPILPPAARFLPKGDSDIADAAARAVSPTYKRVAIRSIYELLQLQSHVRPLLPRVKQPVLAIHSRQDHACSMENVDILQREVGGTLRSVILQSSYHVVSVDVDKEHAAEEIVGFVKTAAANPPSVPL
jgi:carboxylesterase